MKTDAKEIFARIRQERLGGCSVEYLTAEIGWNIMGVDAVHELTAGGRCWVATNVGCTVELHIDDAGARVKIRANPHAAVSIERDVLAMVITRKTHISYVDKEV